MAAIAIRRLGQHLHPPKSQSVAAIWGWWRGGDPKRSLWGCSCPICPPRRPVWPDLAPPPRAEGDDPGVRAVAAAGSEAEAQLRRPSAGQAPADVMLSGVEPGVRMVPAVRPGR
ncbi:hypothetical protein FAIPA1_10585 [Frankia sp. AiPs1]